jgi:hypothetical protein
VHRREGAKPNQIWQAEHTLLDLWVLTPVRPAVLDARVATLTGRAGAGAGCAHGDGRKAALDLRLLGLPMTGPGKIETAAERITDMWQSHSSGRASSRPCVPPECCLGAVRCVCRNSLALA